jgi:hypothetical protein
MGIVDLRGREREPQVLELLDPDPAWTVIGWSRDDRLVACAAVERTSEDEVAIRALAAHAEPDARALLDELARVATCERLVADVGAGESEVYRQSGFMLDAGGGDRVRCTRVLEEPAAQADALRSFTLSELEAAIRAAWGRETSDDPDEWTEENPARGQCAVTALLVRELLGGDILVANVLRDGRRIERHAWNRLSSGITLDLTREQFANGEALGEPVVEEPVLTERNPERFATLRERVRAELGLEMS